MVQENKIGKNIKN